MVMRLSIAPGCVTAWSRNYLVTGVISLYRLYKRSTLGRVAPLGLVLIKPIQTSAPVNNYYIRHKAGKKNSNADALSCSPVDDSTIGTVAVDECEGSSPQLSPI